jgi:pyruvate/2-oxoglutarate dehydrogenase complex dihydrolipoamide dehydrogenase (E3) component
MPDVIVVGAGQSGLKASAALASRGFGVTLVERLPVCGGQEPERPQVDELARAALSAGVEVLAETTAVAWSRCSLTTLGVGGAHRVAASALLVATGTHPATAGELRIAGDRCAGVWPGSAALHLINCGVLPGRRPAVLGGGSLARSCVALLARAGGDGITVIAPDGVLLDMPLRSQDRLYDGWNVHAVHGWARVSAVTVEAEDRRERLMADALVLAHRRIPMRNIDGAVGPGDGIVFCQPTGDPKRDGDVDATVAHAVDQLEQMLPAPSRDGLVAALPSADASVSGAHRSREA